jgi:hypothetical protein
MSCKFLLTVAIAFFSFSVFAQRKVNQKPVPAEVKVSRLENGVNTSASDFAPTRYGNRIYYTSIYKSEKDGNMVSRIYSFMEGGKKQLVDELNMKQKSSHISHVAFMPDASRIYFTICRDDNQEDCQIWYREKEFSGGWGVAERLPDFINQRGSTSTQPAIGWDEEQKKFALFFVSNRPGGRGGLDIWVSHINWKGEFETPYVLPINTEKDDITPYFDRSSQILYFSTNGREAQGGFDVFQSVKKGDMWAPPTNLGRPINSAYDDLYYMKHEVSGKAYLTSDRPGSLCRGGNIDGWNCYDIYEVVRIGAFEMYSSKLGNENSTVMHEIENDEE